MSSEWWLVARLYREAAFASRLLLDGPSLPRATHIKTHSRHRYIKESRTPQENQDNRIKRQPSQHRNI